MRPAVSMASSRSWSNSGLADEALHHEEDLAVLGLRHLEDRRHVLAADQRRGLGLAVQAREPPLLGDECMHRRLALGEKLFQALQMAVDVATAGRVGDLGEAPG